MGYWIEDNSGYLDDFASGGGLSQFRAWATGQGDGPIAHFIRDGISHEPAILAGALRNAHASDDVEELRASLLEMAQRASGPLLLTDGSDGGDDDAEEADDATMEALYAAEARELATDIGLGAMSVEDKLDYAQFLRDRKGDRQEASAVKPAGYTTADAPPSYKDGWVACDLDGTIATHTSNGSVGKPIPAMVERVKKLLADGKDVRIFTARKFDTPETRQAIESWCEEHIGKVLPITNVKHPGVRMILDDKAASVVKNTGELRHPLTPTMKAEAEEETMENDETQELAGNPYHAKDGKFTTAGGMKGSVPTGKSIAGGPEGGAEARGSTQRAAHAARSRVEAAFAAYKAGTGSREAYDAALAVYERAAGRLHSEHARIDDVHKESGPRAQATSRATKRIDAMSAASFGTALRAVTGRNDFAAAEIGTIRQITKVGAYGKHEVVRAKTWSAALRLATAKWGTKR